MNTFRIEHRLPSGPFAVFIDLSGSVSAEQLERALEFTNWLRIKNGGTIRLMAHSRAFGAVLDLTLSRAATIKDIEAHVGGGSPVEDLFTYLSQHPNPPAYLYYVSDGIELWPKVGLTGTKFSWVFYPETGPVPAPPFGNIEQGLLSL